MIFLIPVAFILIVVGTGYFLSAPRYRGPVSDHFNGKKFFTPGGKPAKGFKDVLTWMLRRKRGPWKESVNSESGSPPPSRVGRGTRITFVNHSTFLIQTDGINILTDPVWSLRVSPFSWAGPKRMRPPGIRFEDLPRIDVVLLSHNHYDHLDIATMKMIFEKHHPKIITALGVGAYLGLHGIDGVSDLDWWDQTSLTDSVSVQSVPAQHFSGRGTFDRDATLWCGFVIKRMGGNIYFAGDTGYNENFFSEIGRQCAPLSIALIPIGAFQPEWFMSPIHCSPAEAVKIHMETKSHVSVASHFGTFPLADDGQETPCQMLLTALEKEKVLPENFIALKEGEGREFQ